MNKKSKNSLIKSADLTLLIQACMGSGVLDL
jgi:hypothetical protein